MTAPFATAMTVEPQGAGLYKAELSAEWTIGPKVHGGTLQALCAAAAQAEFTMQGAAEVPVEPVAVSADFLGAPDPGVLSLQVRTIKRGRRISLLEVELSQGEKVAVRAAVTLAAPDSEPPALAVPGAAHAMAPEPPADAVTVADSPMANIVNLSRVCDMRMDRSSAAFMTGQQGDPELRLWVRPLEEEPSTLFALMCGDICAPVTLNLGRFGWAPTIQLTTYVRRVPSAGWLRIVASSSTIGRTWFEEDQVVLDQSGLVVAQGRQLAMVPASP